MRPIRACDPEAFRSSRVSNAFGQSIPMRSARTRHSEAIRFGKAIPTRSFCFDFAFVIGLTMDAEGIANKGIPQYHSAVIGVRRLFSVKVPNGGSVFIY